MIAEERCLKLIFKAEQQTESADIGADEVKNLGPRSSHYQIGQP